MLQRECDAYVGTALDDVPASNRHLKEIKMEQTKDEVCQKFVTYCTAGWLDKPKIQGT